jgi:hypothetical protein
LAEKIVKTDYAIAQSRAMLLTALGRREPASKVT